MTSPGRVFAATAGTLISLAPGMARACAVCGLDGPGSIPVAALLFLMVMPFVVAGSVGAWLFYMHRRTGRTGRETAPAVRPNWMKRKEPTLQPRLWGALGLLVIAGGSMALWPSARDMLPRITERLRRSGASETFLEKLDQYGRVPEFSLVERSGRSVTLADLRGKVWVASFIYTQCTETCPTQSLQFSLLQEEFATHPDLRLVSITVDPERDPPEVLTRYAERYQADPERWLFLTGAKRAIYQLATDGFRLSVVDPDDPKETSGMLRLLGPRSAFATHGSRGLLLHSSRFVLVDRQAHIRAYHQPADRESLERIRRNLQVLLKES